MADMKPRHCAALALVGWYLMTPPTQEQLDSTCRGGPSIMDRVAALVGRDDADKVHTRRCDQEGIEVALDAPLSVWDQSGEFETLKECKVEQQKPMTEQQAIRLTTESSIIARKPTRIALQWRRRFSTPWKDQTSETNRRPTSGF